MSDYRRWRLEGGTYAFSAVTCDRQPILTTEPALNALRAAFRLVRFRWPFRILAIVVLPDHLHSVWELPRGDSNYSVRWKRLKEEVTRRFLRAGGSESTRSASRHRQGERAVWQRRFWEHTIVDEEDLQCCVDYIHYNPVKHGIVLQPRDYRWSSFRRFVKLGEYDINWGRTLPLLTETAIQE